MTLLPTTKTIKHETYVHSIFSKSANLSTGLTDDFKAENNHIPWRAIKGMRNVVVHKYGEVDMETLWDALTNDLPKLKENCKKLLENQASLEDI